MKKIIVLFFLIFTIFITKEVNADSLYNKVNYKTINMDGFSSVVDTFVLKDGGYLMLVYEKVYESDSSFKFTANYYLFKFNASNELVYQKQIDHDKLFTSISSIEPDGSKVIMSTSNQLYLYDPKEDTLSEINVEPFTYLYIRDIIPLEANEMSMLNGFLIVGDGRGYNKLVHNPNGIIMRYKADYTVDWINQIDLIDSQITTAVQLNRLEYIVVGKTFKCISSPNIPCSGVNMGFIAKYSFTGHKVWGQEMNMIPNAVIKTDDDQILVGGKSVQQYGIITNHQIRYAGGLMKYDPLYGDLLWKSEFSTKQVDTEGFIITDLIETKDKKILATGLYEVHGYYNFHEEQNQIYDDGEYFDQYSQERPGFIVQFDVNGKPLKESLMKQVVYYHMNLLNDENILFAGDRFPDTIIQENDYYYHRVELNGVYNVEKVTDINFQKAPMSPKSKSNLVWGILCGGFTTAGVLWFQKKMRRS